MKYKHFLMWWSLLLLPACNLIKPSQFDNTPKAPPESAPVSQSSSTSASATASASATIVTMLQCTEQVSRLSSDEIEREISKLDKQIFDSHSRTLTKDQQKDSFQKRFWLTCLLGRENASDKDFNKAVHLADKLLKEQQKTGSTAETAKTTQLVDLLKRRLMLIQQLRQKRSQVLELNSQVKALQQKIEQLKGLERDLDPGLSTKPSQ